MNRRRIMPNYNYNKGVRLEREEVNEARAKGWIAFRSAGSHSVVDVVKIDYKNKILLLVQCKPKSMSDHTKLGLMEKYKYIEGDYKVYYVVK